MVSVFVLFILLFHPLQQSFQFSVGEMLFSYKMGQQLLGRSAEVGTHQVLQYRAAVSLFADERKVTMRFAQNFVAHKSVAF